MDNYTFAVILEVTCNKAFVTLRSKFNNSITTEALFGNISFINQVPGLQNSIMQGRRHCPVGLVSRPLFVPSYTIYIGVLQSVT